jgi:putative DNA methylase
MSPPKLARGAKFKCICCNQTVPDEHIRAESVAGRMGAKLMAIVAEGNVNRVFMSPNEEHERAAMLGEPINLPQSRWRMTLGIYGV